MSEKIAEVKSLEEDVKLQEYSSKLYNLRKDGVNKVMSLQQEILAASGISSWMRTSGTA